MVSLLFLSILLISLNEYVGNGAKLPEYTLGFYTLIADDTVANYTSTADWQPYLLDYQIAGTNVLWLTFINPQLMPAVPPAMANLAKCKGKPGCPPISTPVIFSIGGQAYSTKAWPWLASSSAAESMAAEVATWDTKYGCDGVDLDIEGSAGSQTAGNNLVAFAKKLRELNPNMIITQPVYGSPQIAAENTMVNQGFTKNGQSLGLIDSVGIMVYNDEGSLAWVKDYGNATSQWDGFPIKVDVPYSDIIVGINGNAGSGSIATMASDIKSQGLGGMMTWLSSVWDATKNKPAFTYGGGAMDATKTNTTTGPAWEKALQSWGPMPTYAPTNHTTTPAPIPIGGCLFQSQGADSKNHQLNLTKYQGTALAKVDDNNQEIVYEISPCDNILTCNNMTVMSTAINIVEMECMSYLSMWKGGTTIPHYDSNEKIWQFIYTNGQQCDNGFETIFETLWVCDPNMMKAQIISAISNQCQYTLVINSSDACN